MFLACFGDNVQAAAGAEFVRDKLNGKNVYLLRDNSTEYTTLLAKYFKEAFTKGGGKIVARGRLQERRQVVHRPDHQAEGAVATKPDVLYVAAMPDDIGLVVKQMRQAGVTQPIVGGDGYDTPLLLSVGGAASNDVYYSTHAYHGDGQHAGDQEVLQGLQGGLQHAPENAFAALGYDTVGLVADAIKRAGSDRPGQDPRRARRDQGLQGHHRLDLLSGRTAGCPQKTVSMIGVKDDKLMLWPRGDAELDSRRREVAARSGAAGLPGRPLLAPNAGERTHDGQGSGPIAGLMAELESTKIEYLRFELPDMHGVSRSKTVPIDKVESYARRGLNFYGGVLGPRHIFQRRAGERPARRRATTPTRRCFPIPTRCGSIPWLDKTASVVCLGYWDDGEPQRAAPRWVFVRTGQAANALGYDVMMGHEYEYYLLTAETKGRLFEGIHIFHTVRNQYTPFLDRLRAEAPAPTASTSSPIIANMPARSSRQSTAPALNLAAADKAFAFKNGMKELAHRHGLIASFMAKPFAGMSGSGCHLHVSLWNRKTGANAFFDPAAGWRLGRRALIHRRRAGARAGDDAADQPDAQLLSPGQALYLRAFQRQLGRPGPLGDGAGQGDQRRPHPYRDARPARRPAIPICSRRRARRRPPRRREQGQPARPGPRDDQRGQPGAGKIPADA